MSIPRPGADRRSVAEVMDSVFWEYRPRSEKNPRACTVAEFFEGFDECSGLCQENRVQALTPGAGVPAEAKSEGD